ncbi:MAG: enoyl-CoA hydratase/isomerase family protein [Actinomycetota bacterium]
METVLYELAGGVATITMNRPEALNATNATLSEELLKSLEQASGDAQVRCVILTGSGKGFCAGADLGQFTDAFASGETPSIGEVLRNRYHPLVESIITMPKPVVAGLNGVAAGMGASLALACDFRIASDKARLTMAFTKIAVVPDSGATHLLPRLIGLAKATELSLLNPLLNADDLLRLGLVNEVVPDNDFKQRLQAFATDLAKGPTLTFGLAKKALRFGAEHDISQSMEYEAELQEQVAKSHDMPEGIAAFVGKREPKFEGR